MTSGHRGILQCCHLINPREKWKNKSSWLIVVSEEFFILAILQTFKRLNKDKLNFIILLLCCQLFFFFLVINLFHGAMISIYKESSLTFRYLSVSSFPPLEKQRIERFSSCRATQTKCISQSISLPRVHPLTVVSHLLSI